MAATSLKSGTPRTSDGARTFRESHPTLEVRWNIVLSTPKRLFDIGLSLAVIAFASPLFLLVAVLVKLTSRGPMFFKQERIGLGGRPFVMLKFRSMQADASDEPHRKFVTSLVTTPEGAVVAQGKIYKLTRDARITPFGSFLRRTSLDELPQFFNVLRGQMSIVGPRPPLAYEVDLYQPWQMERLTVLPGITGLWQVSGRNRKTYLEMCMIDVEYVRGWRFSQDLTIAAKTPFVMVFNLGKTA